MNVKLIRQNNDWYFRKFIWKQRLNLMYLVLITATMGVVTAAAFKFL